MNHNANGRQRRIAPLLPLVLASIHHIVGRLRDERGSTATEYAILVTLVAIAIVAGVLFFGQNLDSWFHRLGDVIKPYVN